MERLRIVCIVTSISVSCTKQSLSINSGDLWSYTSRSNSFRINRT